MDRNEQISPHIQAWELYTHAAHGYKERPITRDHVDKYADSLDFAERLRFLMNWVRLDRLGQSRYKEQGIQVTSGYRHIAYNLKIGSGDTSMHTDPMSYELPFRQAPCALDLTPYPIKGEGAWKVFNYDEFYKMAEMVDESYPDRPYRIGYYGKSLFVHVDCGYGHRSTRWVGN